MDKQSIRDAKCTEITPEKAKELGFVWTLSDETRRKIEAVERNAREAPYKIGHIILRGSNG